MKNILKLSLSTIVSYAFLLNASFANHPPHKHKTNEDTTSQIEENITPKPNEAILVVHGIVCSFCSIGIQKKLKKLDFVDTSKYNKKGSLVNIDDQRVIIAFKKNSNPDINLIFKTITSGGYNPIKAYVSNAQGKVTKYLPKND